MTLAWPAGVSNIPEEWQARRSERYTSVCIPTNTLMVASLYIRDQYQGRGYGKLAMDLLERVAAERYNAEWITLDTTAYLTTREGKYVVEDKTRPGRTIAWYEARGYRQFKVRWLLRKLTVGLQATLCPPYPRGSESLADGDFYAEAGSVALMRAHFLHQIL
jgi:GNAT superfamily N-acetyltransferase